MLIHVDVSKKLKSLNKSITIYMYLCVGPGLYCAVKSNLVDEKIVSVELALAGLILSCAAVLMGIMKNLLCCFINE